MYVDVYAVVIGYYDVHGSYNRSDDHMQQETYEIQDVFGNDQR